MRKIYFLLLTLLSLAFSESKSQISLAVPNGNYNQNFDVMGSTGTTYPAGWAGARFAGTGTINQPLTLSTTTGTTTTGGVYNVGSASSGERALGTLASGSTIPVFGASFSNNTGSSITSFNISAFNEQWKTGSNAVNEVVVFEYSTDATSLTTGTWTSVSSLNLSEILTTNNANGAVDGNDPANRTAISGLITVNIPNGNTIWIRWRDADNTGSDGLYAVDDFVMSYSNSAASKDVSVTSGTNASEPSTNGSFTINFSTPTTAASTNIDFSFGGAATFGTDYTVSYSTGTTTSTTSTGTLSVPAGTSAVTVTITPVDDALVEPSENISLTISNPSDSYTITGSPATIVLNDNDLATASVAAGVNAAEPSTNGTFIINLSNPAPAGGVTVNYILGGTASNSVDYTDALGGSITIPQGNSSGTITLTTIDDALLEGNETINITLTSANNSYVLATSTANISLIDNEIPRVVVNQVYGGGGNTGAIYKNDFIELYNNENVAVNLSGWSVQYGSSGGTSWQVTTLSGSIPAHGFYLVQEAAGSGGTTNLPTPDASGGIAMSATAGKVLLSNGTAALTGAHPATGVIDLVGYGSANGFEVAATDAATNTSSVKRATDGVDTDNNSVDFIITDPEPRNSTYTTAPPVIFSLTPTDNSTDVPYNISTSITFDKTVVKGTGNIIVYENGVPMAPIDVNSPSVTITNNRTVNIAVTYTPGKSYYINIDAGAFKDVYGNNFVGITNSTTWNFSISNSTTPQTLPVTYDFQNCTGTGLLPNGFTQFSALGDIVWDCTSFGRDPSSPAGTAPFPNAVQINGFSNGTNQPNIDWLISPSLDLTGTTYPLLSFWSRTAFNGQPLQLKVSTDYPGTGDPGNYTWTDVNGKFPSQTSNVWTLSDNINLAAFKQPNVHFAFVYNSTDEDGARWTVDDISVINSATPPPPSLTVGTTDVQFNFVANGSSGDKTFTFIGNDLTDGVTVTSTGAFLVSKDGVSFSPSITYTAAEANNINETVYVRFTPTQSDQEFAGTVTVVTGTLSATVNLKGTSIDPATTLEVVNWNMEWFGSTSLGPTNDDQQEQNAETILKNIGADVFGLVEVVDEARLARIVSHMPGYSYIICNYGSHANPNESGASPLSEAQKEAFVFKTSLLSNISTRPMMTNGVNTAADLSNPNYNYFSSGRYPFMMTADVTLNGVTKNVKFVLLHAKANTSPTATAYARRKAGADALHDTLNTEYPNDNILMLGDFNDDLDVSITAGQTTTSYIAFTSDPSNFFSPTLALSNAGKKSTVEYNDMIDHVMLSNDLQPFYMPSTATVLSDVSSLVSNYGSTTSDHYPVFTRYMFCKLTPPANITVSNDQGQCGAVVNFTVGQTMTCGTVTTTVASGSFFPIGATTVTATASTGEVTSFVVTVNDTEKPQITAPDNISVNADPGQCSASVSSLGTPQTSDNCGGVLTVTNDHPSNTYGAGTTTVTWTVTDTHGNTMTATQTVVVKDAENPMITCPGPATVNCGSSLNPSATGTPTATDNCTPAASIGITYSDQTVAGNCSGNYTINRTWKATDASGNFSTCVQVITVVDNTPPTFTRPADITIYTTSTCTYNASVSVTGDVTNESDNCSTGLQATFTDVVANGSCPGKKIITRTWHLVDNCGNHAPDQVQTITVADNTPPVITCTTNKTVTVNNNGCSYKVSGTQFNVTATDNCSPAASITYVYTLTGATAGSYSSLAGVALHKGVTNVKVVATDACGNSSNPCNYTVTVSSTLAATIPDVWALSSHSGISANTIYFGYLPASILIVTASPTGGHPGYDYHWSAPNNNLIIVPTSTKTVLVSTLTPNSSLPYILSLTVTDDYGCTVTVTKQLRVLNVLDGRGLKVNVCHKGKTLAVDQSDVDDHLRHGDYIGSCSSSHREVSGDAVERREIFDAKALPNPSSTNFTIVTSSSSTEKISLRVIDGYGRLVEKREGIAPGSSIQLGALYRPGYYFVEVTQGDNRQQLKLIKQ